MNFGSYQPETDRFYDELFAAVGQPHPGLEGLVEGINNLKEGHLMLRQRAAEHAMMTMGITFTLRDESGETNERILPFDLIPRIIAAQEWKRLEAGIAQRLEALNHFLSDVYGEQKILRDGVVPRHLVESCPEFRPQCKGLVPPGDRWIHVSGTDLVRDKSGEFFALEDNARCPSGVSYVLENRQLIKRSFPSLFQGMNIRRVDDYPMRLLETLQYIAPNQGEDPRVVVMTPGRFNSAYYEHCFLAQQMGVDLVEPQDLVVHDGYVLVRTTHGLERVDVIYRRVGDDYLDPEAFRPDSLLGIPGVMRSYLEGKVALANAPGTGVSDDKAVYCFVEKMIKYYLDQDAIISNVPTFLCTDDKQRQHVLENLENLVVKATDGAGGYGMLIGPHSTEEERMEFQLRIKQNPRGYIAQPVLSLSRVPTIVEDRLEPRHVDLRPFALSGKNIYIQPGGLTRVALRRGSLVVNSSQGGGSKDTWVLTE